MDELVSLRGRAEETRDRAQSLFGSHKDLLGDVDPVSPQVIELMRDVNAGEQRLLEIEGQHVYVATLFGLTLKAIAERPRTLSRA